jgi:hypothetical protein
MFAIGSFASIFTLHTGQRSSFIRPSAREVLNPAASPRDQSERENESRMTPMEISRQPAPRFVLRHAPRRTVAFVAIDLAWALMFGLHAVLPPTGPPWSDALGCLLGAALAYFAMVVAVQAVRGNPVLEASDAGIAINSPWGRMFVRWSETSEFSAGRYRWLQIRLREGARPVCSPWTRMLNASLWARTTIVVPAFTTAENPAEIARRLTVLRSHHVANEPTNVERDDERTCPV